MGMRTSGSRQVASRSRVLAVLIALALTALGCGNDDPPAPTPPEGLVVASFNFPESDLLAEIYAQALEVAGFQVHRELGLGPRELVLPAIRQGFVDLVPEYIGAALEAVEPGPALVSTDPVVVHSALRTAVQPWSLDVLEPAPAANQNTLAVTAAAAQGRNLRTISDLRPVAGSLTLGGPPECPQRRQCLLGLESVYGLRFGAFLPVSGEQRIARALEEGVIDVGVLFTTDGVLAGDDLVVLDDDRSLQPPENVAPLVRADLVARSPGVVPRLDEVSAQLTTGELRFLNWRITVGGGEPAEEARGWLIRRGLIPR